jgi:hypothetical protein
MTKPRERDPIHRKRVFDAAIIALWQHHTRLLVMGVALSLAGCAGTDVGLVTSHAPVVSLGPPRTITVIVEDDSPLPERKLCRKTHLDDVQAVSGAFAQSLSKLLASRQLAVVPPDQPADLILRGRILDVCGGSKALRVLVGYGAGKAILEVGVSLNDPRTPQGPPLLSFKTNSTSGAMPGGAYNVSGLVGVGLNALREDGLPKEIDQATAIIDQQLSEYFLAQNWPYPKPAETDLQAWLHRHT